MAATCTTRAVAPRDSGLPDVAAGGRLDEFDLLVELGAGSFAKVFLARQRSLQRMVALKVSATVSDEPQTLAQLDHPHIVRVYDQRLLDNPRCLLLYMQYVPGGTLAEVIQTARAVPPSERSGRSVLAVVDRALEGRGESPPDGSDARRRLARLSWPEAVCYVGARLAGALQYAHRRGVLHRDIKPANVLMSGEGSPKLADFNISFSSEVEGATARSFFGGSVAYMSPEQLEAYNPEHPRCPEELDGRSDVYALGLVLWELLVLRRPFQDVYSPESWVETISAMARSRREGLSAETRAELPANCPRGLGPVLFKCLAPEPDDRYADAGQLARQLELCLDPQAQEVLYPPPQSWLQRMGNWPLTSIVAVALAPNIALSALNIFYNLTILEEPFPEVVKLFRDVQLGIVNLLAYTLAPTICFALTWPVIAALRRPPPEQELPPLRRRCLALGHCFALVGFATWIATGVAFAVWIDVAHQQETVWRGYLHLMASITLCGLIAAPLTFFAVTRLAVGAFYRRLLPEGAVAEDAPDDLRRCGRRVTWYFGALVIAPLLAILALTLIGSQVQPAFGALAVLGAVGFGLAFWLGRQIQSDLAALLRVVSAGGTHDPGADETGGLLVGSRR